MNMAEKEQNFNQDVFEKKLPEIEGLRERISEKESEFEVEDPETKKEIIKDEIKGKLRELQSFSDIPLSARDEVREISKFSDKEQVEALVSLVFEKGLIEAVSVSQRIDNPAVIDDFHNILTNKYYEMLVNQGIIKI